MQIPASFDSVGMFLGYPVRSPVQRYKQTPEVGRADGFNRQFLLIFAYFGRIVLGGVSGDVLPSPYGLGQDVPDTHLGWGVVLSM